MLPDKTGRWFPAANVLFTGYDQATNAGCLLYTSDAADEEAESGLKARYEQALRDGAPDPGDASFAKYIAAANLQR